jgi:hypothetical protein
MPTRRAEAEWKAKEIVSRRALSYARIVIVEESDLRHGRE